MGRPKKFNREGVLEKALPVFWRRGFADASLHELEMATGVNKSGLYSEFKDKEDLFTQSLQYYLESLEKKGLLTAEPLGGKQEVVTPAAISITATPTWHSCRDRSVHTG